LKFELIDGYYVEIGEFEIKIGIGFGFEIEIKID